ncbi:hypothetical protein [Streptomyces collinus]|uniref:hypothetical protein n=1 Tax=Streptomyces collinus TaxID=42684 RepID=UPI0029431ECD|nr:hypothetical protein [Streptomyces collinus]
MGLAFGLACSALLCPVVRVRSAEHALGRLRTLPAHRLNGLADAVARREQPRHVLGPARERDLDTALTRARAAVDEAHESVRWNVRPTARRHRRHLDRRVPHTPADVERQVCAAGRLLDARPPAGGGGVRPGDAPAGDGFTRPYARLLRTTALCATTAGAAVRTPPCPPRGTPSRGSTAPARGPPPGPRTAARCSTTWTGPCPP